MGRPCEFDEDEALDRAMRAFWEGGYDATSLEQLQAATGMGRQSLYNAFGDKRALFLRCLERYHARGLGRLREQLGEPPLRRAVAGLFEYVATRADKEKRAGCLQVNTAMELAARDVEVGDLVARFQRDLEAVFTEALEAARRRGELSPRFDCRATGRFLVGTFLGLLVLAKGDPRSEAPADVAKVALRALDP